MNEREALEIVISLAYGNALSERDCRTDANLDDDRKRQEKALDVVEDIIANLGHDA